MQGLLFVGYDTGVGYVAAVSAALELDAGRGHGSHLGVIQHG